MKQCLVVSLLASSLLTGCVTWAGKPPPCPPPSPDAIEGVMRLFVENELRSPSGYGPLLYWIGEVERYCSAIAEMIDS